MPKVISKRTFLLKQDDLGNGKFNDVIVEAGKEVEVTDKEFKQFRADFADNQIDKAEYDRRKKKYEEARKREAEGGAVTVAEKK